MATQEEVDAFLAHHGILGMHWGVRKAESNEEEGRGSRPTNDPRVTRGRTSSKSTGGTGKGNSGHPTMSKEAENEAKRQYMAIPPLHRSEAEGKKALADSEAKFAAKFAPSEATTEKKGLSAGQKRAIKIGVGVAAVGGLVALGVYADRQNQGLANELHSLAGEAVDAEKFQHGVNLSKSQTWMRSGYIQPSSYEREEFTLPAGHIFHRISQVEESSFKDHTYMAPNIDDFNRYVVGFRGEKGDVALHHISFSANEPIKVPSLTTTLETVRETLVKQYEEASPMGKGVLDSFTPSGHTSKEHALEMYEKMSGGGWTGKFESEFISALKAKGYDAIVDEMDAGVIGDKPLVLFNHEKMGQKSSSPLTDELIDKAEKELKELTSRKFGIYGKSFPANTIEEGVSGVRTGRQLVGATHSSIDEVDEFLAHFGVKGMHWGVRHAKADAHEYVKARLAIGEGAGNRRKLINAKVAARSKNPEYKKAFDTHVENFSQHNARLARQARVNKNVKAARKSTFKTARGVHRSLTGGFGGVSLASATIAGAALYAHRTGLDKKIFQTAAEKAKHADYNDVAAWLKDQGVY